VPEEPPPRTNREPDLTREELTKVEKYLRTTFGTANLAVRARPRKDDSAEVYIGEEFIGVLSKDVDEGETSYHLQVAILEMDLE
jgi:hypothetical protein